MNSMSMHYDLFHVWPQFDEQKDQVAVEQILRVVFLDVERPSPVSEDIPSLIRACLRTLLMPFRVTFEVIQPHFIEFASTTYISCTFLLNKWF